MKKYFHALNAIVVFVAIFLVASTAFAQQQNISVTVDNSIYEIPDKPTIVRSENITTNTADLVVQVGALHANTTVDYVVTITNTATGDVTTQEYKTGVNGNARSTLQVTNLTPGTTYDFVVSYSRDNENVFSENSDVHTATTLINPPVLDSISDVTTDEMRLNVVVNPAFVGSPMDFIVEVKNEETGDTYTVQMTKDVTSSSVALDIDDLEPGTEYSFRVKYAREDTGYYSGYSNRKSEYTDLDAPTIDDIRNTTSDSMDVVVEVDGAFTGETMDFTMEVTNVDTGETYTVDYTLTVGNDDRVVITVNGLTAGTNYSFRVKYAREDSDQFSDYSNSKGDHTEPIDEFDDESTVICYNDDTVTIPLNRLDYYKGLGATEGACPVDSGETPVVPGGETPVVPGDDIIFGGSTEVEDEEDIIKEELREAIVPEERKTAFESVAAVGAVTGSAIALAGSAVPLFTAMPGAFSSSIFLRFIELFGIIGRRKEERNWGVAFERTTHIPIPAVKILLLDEMGKELATTYSDKEGRFGFLAAPGKYILQVFKKDHALVTDMHDDELYGKVYDGGTIEIREDEVVLENIAMNALNIDWAAYSEKKIRQYKSKWSVFKKYLFLAIYVLGFGATVIVTYFYPSTFNFVMLSIYVILFLYQLLVKKKKYGMIETTNGKPVPFAVVSLHDKDSDAKHKFAVTDSVGRYYLLADNGQYKVKAKGQPVSGSKFEKHGQVKVKDGIVRKDIVV
jgi:hypothetical protein